MTILTNFQPKRREISAVSLATQAVITTTEDHGYEVDQFVRIFVPSDYGMDLEYVKAKVVAVPTDSTFTVDYDSTSQAAYVDPSFPPAFTQSHCVPITGTELNNTSITG